MQKCALCDATTNLTPGVGPVAKLLRFCPACKAKLEDMRKAREEAENDPVFSKDMQQTIRCEWGDACKCEIVNPEEECYSGRVMHVFEAPEESDTPFGYGTTRIHAKCGKPVYVSSEQHRAEIKADIQVQSWRRFFNK